MKSGPLVIIVLLCTIASSVIAQTPKIKFGKINQSDFETSSLTTDSGAHAVIIADIGSTEIVGNKKGYFSLEFKNYRRAVILNNNGFDLASIEIPLYKDGEDEEELLNLKAVTYNLENGKIIETKLDVKSVFKDVLNKHLVVKKFTFPNVKPGSIIEYEYKIRSDFMFNLQPWEFQTTYPVKWSEYTVSIPEFYYYITLTQGFQPYFIKDQKDKRSTFTVVQQRESGGLAASQEERFVITAGVTDFHWVMKDVPALHEEGYTTTLKNHVARIEFQLAELKEPLFTGKTFKKTWAQATEELLAQENFGAELYKDNEWLTDIIKTADDGATDDLTRVKNYYAFIRDKMTCTNYSRRQAENPLKTVWRNKNGNVAEINLLLTALLIKAGYSAEPVILSTRQHGYVYSLYPLMDRINYVITQLKLNGKTYYLDATHPDLGFGKLTYDCYNGHARVVNKEATPLELKSEFLLEQSLTSVLLINDGKGNMSGSFQQTPGYTESYRLRSEIKEKGQESFFTKQKKSYDSDITISDSKIDSLAKLESPLTISYKFKLNSEKQDIIYFNPMLSEAWNENPFKSAKRYYPVEMPYTVDQIYTIKMDIPEGYEVDEIPKEQMVKLNSDDEGNFEYRVSVANGSVSIRSRIRIKRTYFAPEEYDMLREFFNLIVKKHNEQIVFKKKK